MSKYFFGAAFHGQAHEGGPLSCRAPSAVSWRDAKEQLRDWAADKRSTLCTRCKQPQAVECGHFWVLLDKIPYKTEKEAAQAQLKYIEFSSAMLRETLPPDHSETRFEVLRRPD